MYKDFKKSESLDTGFVGGSGIIWMFSGVVLGLLVGFGMYYFSNNHSSALSMAGTVEDKIKRAQIAGRKSAPDKVVKNRVLYKSDSRLNNKQQQKKEQRTHKFSYYAVLPKIDVPVNASRPINTSSEKMANAKTVGAQKVAQKYKTEPLVDNAIAKRNAFKKENIGDYLLQVASYKKKSSAKVTRGRLSKSGIEAYIQARKVKGRLWYRVVAGPVDHHGVSNWKQTVEKMGLRPLVISIH